MQQFDTIIYWIALGNLEARFWNTLTFIRELEHGNPQRKRTRRRLAVSGGVSIISSHDSSLLMQRVGSALSVATGVNTVAGPLLTRAPLLDAWSLRALNARYPSRYRFIRPHRLTGAETCLSCLFLLDYYFLLSFLNDLLHDLFKQSGNGSRHQSNNMRLRQYAL